MRGKRRGRDADRVSLRAREDRGELLPLVREVEPVARLRLAERRAVDEHPVEAPAHVRRERLEEAARRRDGGDDAAAECRDARVRLALQPAVELVLAEAVPGQVGVRVDRSRARRSFRGRRGSSHRASALAVPPHELRVGPRERDPPVLDAQAVRDAGLRSAPPPRPMPTASRARQLAHGKGRTHPPADAPSDREVELVRLDVTGSLDVARDRFHELRDVLRREVKAALPDASVWMVALTLPLDFTEIVRPATGPELTTALRDRDSTGGGNFSWAPLGSTNVYVSASTRLDVQGNRDGRKDAASCDPRNARGQDVPVAAIRGRRTPLEAPGVRSKSAAAAPRPQVSFRRSTSIDTSTPLCPRFRRLCIRSSLLRTFRPALESRLKPIVGLAIVTATREAPRASRRRPARESASARRPGRRSAQAAGSTAPAPRACATVTRTLLLSFRLHGDRDSSVLLAVELQDLLEEVEHPELDVEVAPLDAQLADLLSVSAIRSKAC